MQKRSYPINERDWLKQVPCKGRKRKAQVISWLETHKNGELYWRLSTTLSFVCTLPEGLAVFFAALNIFFFHDRISVQCSDPDCSSQSNFGSSTNKIVVSMPGSYWSLRWSSYTTILCCHNIEPLSQRWNGIFYTTFGKYGMFQV